mmetsp:Transcript_4537/g.12712  ORF Transcript_4537/g.12712 Transcript_4537/m.12712 type:complete len:379 (-) Transcript_4537:155-1291(-)
MRALEQILQSSLRYGVAAVCVCALLGAYRRPGLCTEVQPTPLRLDAPAGQREGIHPLTPNSTVLDPAAGDPQLIRPVIWLHIPKCGTSFGTTLVHYGCGKLLPENYSALSIAKSFPFSELRPVPCMFHGKEVAWNNTRVASTCKWNAVCGKQPGFNELPFGHVSEIHEMLWPPPSMRPPGPGQSWGAIPNVSDLYLRKVACMFREPRQRMISHWYFAHRQGSSAEIPSEFAQFVRCYSALATQMILGIPGVYWNTCMDRAFKSVDKGQAIRIVEGRVRQFGFVGLADHWAISVCLFHVMFGGDCKAVEFDQLRKGSNRTALAYNVTAFGIDEYDSMDHDTYRVASEVFFDNVIKHGVHRNLCQQRICPKAAAAFDSLA